MTIDRKRAREREMLSLLSRCQATATRQLLRLQVSVCVCQRNVQVQVEVKLKWMWPSRPTLRCNETKSDHNHVNLTERESRALIAARCGYISPSWRLFAALRSLSSSLRLPCTSTSAARVEQGTLGFTFDSPFKRLSHTDEQTQTTYLR